MRTLSHAGIIVVSALAGTLAGLFATTVKTHADCSPAAWSATLLEVISSDLTGAHRPLWPEVVVLSSDTTTVTITRSGDGGVAGSVQSLSASP